MALLRFRVASTGSDFVADNECSSTRHVHRICQRCFPTPTRSSRIYGLGETNAERASTVESLRNA